MINSTLHSVKRKQTKIPWVWLSFGFFVFIAFSMYLTFIVFNVDDVLSEDYFEVCDYSINETQSVIEATDFTEIIEINDYLIYGETLNLFSDSYILNQKDPLIGKTIVVRNVCDGYEWVYMMENNIDGQIPLELLPNGFYEVYIVDNLISKRVVSTIEIEEVFYPVNRDQLGKTIQIIASKNIASSQDHEVNLAHNAMFLKVSDSTTEERDVIYDIVLDGAHSTYVGNSIEKGRSNFNMIESNETVRMAILVQEELEKAGLKVYMTRDDSEDVIDLYGIDGRLDLAYQSQAKYYIEFNMMSSNNSDLSGAVMTYSRYSSNRFATTVFKSYLATGIIGAYGVERNGNIAGVVPASYYQGYDSIPVIRESGGRILGAGTMSEASQTNASFNAQERFGMQTISLDMIHLSNENDATMYANNTELLAKSIAQGIIEFLRLEVNQ